VDAEHEAEMYKNVGRYIKVLNDWECSKSFLFDCVSELSRHLVQKGLWQARDADIVDAWIGDLSTVGYAPPALRTEVADVCIAEDKMAVVFYPEEQPTSMPNTEQLHLPPQATNHKLILAQMTSLCGQSFKPSWNLMMQKAHEYSEMVLVISVYSHVRNVIPKLEALYKPHFSHILYCIGQEHEVDGEFMNTWKLSVVKLNERIGAVACMSAATQMGYHVKGILHITDTMWLNANDGLTRKMPSLAWMTGEFMAFDQAKLTRCAARIQNCRLVNKNMFALLVNQLEGMETIPNIRKKKLRDCLTRLGKDPSWMGLKETVWVTDVAIYLPTRLFRSLSELRQIFLSNPETVANDFMTVLLIECEQLTVEYLKLAGNAHPLSNDVANYDYSYPFTFRTVSHDESNRKAFCQYFEQFK